MLQSGSVHSHLELSDLSNYLIKNKKISEQSAHSSFAEGKGLFRLITRGDSGRWQRTEKLFIFSGTQESLHKLNTNGFTNVA